MLDRGLKVEITENSGYFSCLFLWALFSVLTKSTLSECFLGIYTLNRLVFYASIIIVCIRYISFIRGRESRTILISLLIIISSIMGMYYSGREEIFILALFVVGAVDIDIEYAIKWLFYGELIGTIIVVFLSSTGIIEN
ncbi:MAG: hypothetical protein LUH07_13275, partial [Lachnospiraceae bacterium]|nr:hypothetical protein [Lachnospiraceae bacterium]